MSQSSDFTGVLLAAGQGRRAGGNKLLWPLLEARVIDYSLRAQASVCHRIRVVAGAHFDELEHYIKSHYPNVEVVFNPQWEDGGMFSSVKAGLAGVTTPAFIHPADIPGASVLVYRRLRTDFHANPADFLKPTFNDKGGHPLLLGGKAIGAIAKEDSESNVRAVLSRLSGRRVRVEAPLIHMDVDTRADYEALVRAFRASPGDDGHD